MPRKFRIARADAVNRSLEQPEERIECRFSLREGSNAQLVTKLFQTFGSFFDRTRLNRASEAVDRRLVEDPQAYQKYADRQRRRKEAERKKAKRPER